MSFAGKPASQHLLANGMTRANPRGDTENLQISFLLLVFYRPFNNGRSFVTVKMPISGGPGVNG